LKLSIDHRSAPLVLLQGLKMLRASQTENGVTRNGVFRESNTVLTSFSAGSDHAVERRSRSPSPTNSPVAETAEREGRCFGCGGQLYRIKTKKKGVFRKNKKEVRVPLNIPGQVERGQCLKCNGKSGDDEGQDAVVAASSSAMVPLESTVVATAVRDAKEKATYEGPYNEYGERHGRGVMRWTNGDVYTGEFFNGNRHGTGTLQFADGSEYVGEWECNRQHGTGTRRWNNGDCYTGQYCDGKRTGEGRFYFANGDLYNGAWVDGVMQGHGRYYYASGQRFEGSFVRGKRHGKGKLQYTDGAMDVSVYQQDVRVGRGVRWSPDRSKAWCMEKGIMKKKISAAEAVSIDYELQAVAASLQGPGYAV
jgi:hypothetical protein